MEIKIRAGNLPAQLLGLLARARLSYTNPVAVYYCVATGREGYCCGVFGDGDNGAYEWFVWRNGFLQTSNMAYGTPENALRDALVIALE